jgi:hypothetical protein
VLFDEPSSELCDFVVGDVTGLHRFDWHTHRKPASEVRY